jgi:uncharacterized protein YggU (UPF0235/DUF167 family)
MKFLEKKSDFSYILKLYVKTNCKTQKVINNGDFLTIYLKSKPIQNKANKELIRLIKSRLNIPSIQVQIISGSKSHDKLINLHFLKNTKEKDIIKKLTV